VKKQHFLFANVQTLKWTVTEMEFHAKINTVAKQEPSNYAIKRDLRENTGFKFIIGRVGPLFWLLEPKMQKTAQACILF
jgi:hypothetical protein